MSGFGTKILNLKRLTQLINSRGSSRGQSGHGFTKSFTEHCILLGIVNVRADITYQQGLNRMFSRSTRYDFYWPAFNSRGSSRGQISIHTTSSRRMQRNRIRDRRKTRSNRSANALRQNRTWTVTGQIIKRYRYPCTMNRSHRTQR